MRAPPKNVDRNKLRLKLIRSLLGFGLLTRTSASVGVQGDINNAE